MAEEQEMKCPKGGGLMRPEGDPMKCEQCGHTQPK